MSKTITGFNPLSNRNAFTIVELLIVIVVIAILAAITITAYNGIQQRARNTQVVNGVGQYYKAFINYKSINNTYPTGSGCLGSNYPSNNCWMNGATVHRNVNTSLDAALGEFLSQKPTLATSLMPIGVGSNNRAGLIYDANYSGSGIPTFVWYLAGINQDCGLAGASRMNEGSLVSQCSIALP